MLLLWCRSTVTYGILLRRLMSGEELMESLVFFYRGQEEVFYLGDLLLALLFFLPDPDM